MNYFSGSSLPEYIHNTKVDHLYQPELNNGRLCCIYDVLYIEKNSTPNTECLIFILTDGKYHIPALIHPDLARDQLQLQAKIKDSLSSIKGKVLLISKSAIGAFRWSQGVLPYIIAFDWMVLNVYESAIDPSITPISNNTQVKEWITQLDKSIQKKPSGKNTIISSLYKSNLVHRKFVDFDAIEACLGFFVCCYLNINTVSADSNSSQTPNEETHVQSVGISKKRCLLEDRRPQQEKKRKLVITVDEEEYTIDMSETSPTIQRTTPSTRHYTLDDFLTPEEYQSQVIAKMWSSECEIPDSAIIPVSTLAPPAHVEVVESAVQDSITSAEAPSPAIHTATMTNTLSFSLPDLSVSSQLSSDNEEETAGATREAMYAEAEAMIVNQICKAGATTFERRTGFAHLRNLRLQRDTCEFQLL